IKARWPILLVFAALSSVGWWVAGRKRRLIVANKPEAVPALKSRRRAQKFRKTPQSAAAGKPKERFLSSPIMPVLLFSVIWVALFANNLGVLPGRVGYDSDSHIAYINFIQEKHSLPLAADGWEMFQPPLYYVLGAGVLSLLNLSALTPGGLIALRIMGLVFGLVQVTFAWASLRLIFPAQSANQKWGLALIACLPPLLYLSQYVTNELLAATLATVCIYLCLRLLRNGLYSWKACVGLGVCLGFALLAKTTNVLLLPAIAGALIWRKFERHEGPPGQWAYHAALILLAAGAVCGWHYARVWHHYGNPLIGNWDPKVSYAWWMEDGYRTWSYYARLGNVLLHPWFAGFNGFLGGLYSTFWGDGLLAGSPSFADPHPPWNYDFMAIGYWLAILPSAAILVGAALAVVQFIRRPSAEWFLLLGFGFLVALGLVYMSGVVPCGGMAKAFYGLPALLPVCALGALGMNFIAGRHRLWRFIVCVLFSVWAINSFAAVWIVRSSVSCTLARAQAMVKDHQLLEAVDLLTKRLQTDPGARELRLLLVSVLFSAADYDDAANEVENLLREDPGNGRVWVLKTAMLYRQNRMDEAREAAQRVTQLIPGNDQGYHVLMRMLFVQNRRLETIAIGREALALSSPGPALRISLGTALLFEGQDEEASVQFRYAFYVNPECAAALDSMAWDLSTDKEPSSRNGPIAVKLAQQACELTQYKQPRHICTLAAAYAETGRYDVAIAQAERARAMVIASGATNLISRNDELIRTFKSGQPYRQK
ncbi:MAG TPA: tetratricopeptide repeat protein, partial [Verrucomicrobiae bacterium]|nr:tetratricopeptide repeat protein [Verrucomicrobiae bacterium]